MPLDHHEISTPWEPQPIVWRSLRAKSREEALISEARRNSSHLVREVLVRGRRHRSYEPPTQAQVEDAIVDTEEQFLRLRDAGLEIADTTWHIFRDEPDSTIRTLARVGIIEGFKLSHTYNVSGLAEPERSIRAAFNDALDQYALSVPDDQRLCDVDLPRQYLHGTPKALETTSEPKTYLVDIEPIFWLSLYDIR